MTTKAINEKNIDEYIYKDLLYTRDSHFFGEQIYPLWEAVYAIVVTVLLNLYFSNLKILSHPTDIIICVIGMLFSGSWFLIVCRARSISKTVATRMEDLEWALREILNHKIYLKNDKEIKSFDLFSTSALLMQQRKGFRVPFTTWQLRQSISFAFLIIWIILFANALLINGEKLPLIKLFN